MTINKIHKGEVEKAPSLSSVVISGDSSLNANESPVWATLTTTCQYCGGKVKHVCTAFPITQATASPKASNSQNVPDAGVVQHQTESESSISSKLAEIREQAASNMKAEIDAAYLRGRKEACDENAPVWEQRVSDMKAEIVKRVREKVSALHNQREELPREHKRKLDEAIIAVHSLATELEAVQLDQNQESVR